MNVVQTQTMNIRKISEQVITITPLKSFSEDETLDLAMENILALQRMISHPNTILIAQMPNHYIHTEARNYYNSKKELFSGIALFGANFVQMMMGNVFLKLLGPNPPTKLFKNEEDALKWAKSILKKPALQKH